MDHITVFIVLGISLVLFVWGKIRHDFVAFSALLFLVVVGIINPTEAFDGFAHPAVVTVAAVLIIGQALAYSGLIEVVGDQIIKIGDNLVLQIFVLSVVVVIASAFINNVGALAIMMPVILHLSRKSKNSASKMLMPIAFASLLGGMITLIGTPPNIIIASFRRDELGESFRMFDFAPVGIVLSVVGVLFISFLGWRILPKRTSAKGDEDLFDIDEYITEVQITDDSPLLYSEISKINAFTDADFKLIGLVRDENRIHEPEPNDTLRKDDVIVIQTDTDDLKVFIKDTKVSLVGNKEIRKGAIGSHKISFSEAVIMPDSELLNKTASSLKIRTRFAINVLAIARKKQQIRNRIDHTKFRVGDVILVQGQEGILNDTILNLGCLPLAKRSLDFKYRRKITLALSVFVGALALIMSGALSVEIAFSIGALAMIFFKVIPVKEVYTTINWPVIVLLAAMIPVGASLEKTGGAKLIADYVLNLGEVFPAWGMIALILGISMVLSSVINNAATVVLMAPIAMSVARGLDYSIDPFLMAVAIGGSSAFLTPIGHQSNTLVMGPGGYQFSDYFKMGIPMTILVLVFGVVSIMYFWPV